MDQTLDWRDFWASYRVRTAKGEDDLFFQVGKTVNKQPIKKEEFDSLVNNIKRDLYLQPEDNLFEFCCGNGLVTYELRNSVENITAVDFTAHLIEAARDLKSSDNITYAVGSALGSISSYFGEDGRRFPNKFLMNDALAYFDPGQLEMILKNILELGVPDFVFLLTHIPIDHFKFNFYNTPEKKKWYEESISQDVNTIGAIGRWWKPDELFEICQNLSLKCYITLTDQSNYRMDAIIKSA